MTTPTKKAKVCKAWAVSNGKVICHNKGLLQIYKNDYEAITIKDICNTAWKDKGYEVIEVEIHPTKPLKRKVSR